jgi:hypothetical protein
MKAISLTCRKIAETNLGRLPERFIYKGGEPSYEAVQEIFWACMAEITASLLGGPSLPDSVRVAREQVIIPVADHQWQNLRAELGLDRPAICDPVREVLNTQLRHKVVPQTPLLPPGESLADRIGLRLLGFVLFTCHIEQLAEIGPPREFGYEFRELTHLANLQLGWVPIGKFDEGRVAREFFDYAGMRIHASDRLLRIPYHAFWRVLKTRLGASAATSVESASRPASTALPRDFLLRALPEALQRQPTEPIPQQMTPPRDADAERAGLDRAFLDELNRLRAENDRLRQTGVGEALLSLLEPLLTVPGCPADTTERALLDTPVLARDLLHGFLCLLRSPDLELFGELGQEIDLRLPHPQYCLDEVLPPARQDISFGRFRICRRGLRYRGVLLSRASVRPLEDRP